MILAIDPGSTETGFVLLDGDRLAMSGKHENQDFLERFLRPISKGTEVVAEMVACYGMPVGEEVFSTCVWLGEYRRVCKDLGLSWNTITRPQVKQRLCHRTVGVNDSVIRQRLIDHYGPGKEKAIGTKKCPGPLYGVRGDVWAALAVAKAWEAVP